MDCQTMITSDEYADLLLDFTLPDSLVPADDSCLIEIDEDISLLYQKRLSGNVFPISQYRSLYLPTLYAPIPLTQDILTAPVSALEDSGIAAVTRPPLSLSGLGVRIAVIDTGIDYANPAFRNEDGSSRILAIWDQQDSQGTPPPHFPYGSLYTKENLDEALKSENPYQIVPTKDTPGKHGSRLAAIAAGSTHSITRFRGAAPQANLIVVKLKSAKPYLRNYYAIEPDVPCYEESDLIAALKFVSSFVELNRSPVSVLLGVGTNYGDHNGSSLLERYINRLSLRSNLCITCAGGNEGNAAHHYRGTFPAGLLEEQSVEFEVSESNKGFVLQFWGSNPNRFRLSIRSPLGETLDNIAFDLTRSTTFTFLYSNTVLTVDSLISEQFSGEEVIYLRFRTPAVGIWRIIVNPVQVYPPGYYDLWLPMSEFLSSPVTFLGATPYITLTAPSMSENGLCIGAAAQTQGILIPSSGRGYLKNGNIKPDLISIGDTVETIDGYVGGTAPAAALVCGGAALFMEWGIIRERLPFLTGAQIRALFIRGAKRLPSVSYPNPESGYGIFDLENVFSILS